MVYLIVLIMIAATAWLEDRYCQINDEVFYGRRMLPIAICILVGLAACRYQAVESDFIRNYRHVLRMHGVSWGDIWKEPNLANAFLRKGIAEFLKDPQWYFLITAAMLMGCYGKAVKCYAPNYYDAVFLFYTIGFYFSANNVTRQAAAAAITISSWRFILKRDLLRYGLLMFLAIHFHRSAILFIPTYFLTWLPFRRNHVYLYAAAAAVIVIFRYPLIAFFQRFLFDNYVGNAYGTTASNPLRLLLTVMHGTYLVILLRNKGNALDAMAYYGIEFPERFYNFITHSTAIAMILALLSATSMLLFSRLAMYWNAQSLFVLMYAADSSERNRRLFRWVALTAGLIWFLIMNFSGKLIPTPYTPFWLYPDRGMIS